MLLAWFLSSTCLHIGKVWGRSWSRWSKLGGLLNSWCTSRRFFWICYRYVLLYSCTDSAFSSEERLSEIHAGEEFSLRFRCFPELFQARATSYWRKLFVSTSSTTYSRVVLLNLRYEVTRVQYISPVVARASENIHQPSCLRDFRYPALNPGNRKLFSNLSLTSNCNLRLTSVCKIHQ